MTLEFLSDADVGDAELVVRLDLKGLEALLAAMLSAALKARRAPAGTEADADPEGRPLNAFGRVTYRFLDPATFAEPPAN